MQRRGIIFLGLCMLSGGELLDWDICVKIILLWVISGCKWTIETPCIVPKPMFLLETLIVHCLVLFECVFAGFLMNLFIRVYVFDIKACIHGSKDIKKDKI
jgi:hypothetical protein